MFEPLRAVPTIAVSDIEKAKMFYGETLGLKVRDERADGVRYEAGGGSLVLVYPSQFAGTAQSTTVSFEVADLDAVMSDLRGQGVTFEEYDFPGLKTVEGVAEIDGVRGAWFKDPDGNIISVGQEV